MLSMCNAASLCLATLWCMTNIMTLLLLVSIIVHDA